MGETWADLGEIWARYAVDLDQVGELVGAWEEG